MGGSRLWSSFSVAGSCMVVLAAFASRSRRLQSERVRVIGSAASRSESFPVFWMAASVDDSTLPTKVAMSVAWSLMMGPPSSARTLPTSDWIEWTRPSVWLSR